MVINQKKDKDYYQQGSREDVIISNSFLNALDPELGGSPQKAIAFFDRQDEKEESKQMENGKIIHSYAEKPDQFGIAEIPRPSDTMGDLCDEFYRLVSTQNITEDERKDIVISSDLKTDGGRSAEILETKKAYEDLSVRSSNSIETLIMYFRKARRNVNAYRTYKEATVINKVINDGGIEYIKQLVKLENKVILTLTDKDKIENVIKSLRNNPIVNRHLALGDQFDTNVVIKELDIYCTLKFRKVKVRIDSIYIDFENQTIYINDLKTTSKSIAYIKNVIEDRKYYRQVKFYELVLIRSKILQQLLKDNNIDKDITYYKIKHQIFGVETTNNYICQVLDITSYSIKANLELGLLFERAKFHIDNNIWDRTKEEVEGGGVITLKPQE